MNEAWVTPIIGGVFLIASGLLALISVTHNRRQGGKESRMPTVEAAWNEADHARAMMRAFEEAYYLMRNALKSIARRVLRLYPDFEFTPEELAAIQAKPPRDGGAE